MIRYFALIVLTISISQLQALAQHMPQPKDPTEIDKISPDTVVFFTLKSPEFFPNSQQTGTANNLQSLLELPQFNPSITRQFLWKMRVPLNKLQLPLKANYQVIPRQVVQGNPFANVQFQDDTVELISQDAMTNTAIVQGKVNFVFLNLENLTSADTYTGMLSVCLKDRDDACM
ncbi:hypothetical protein NUACC21_48960 [Scytonema sp. NUACC21]